MSGDSSQGDIAQQGIELSAFVCNMMLLPTAVAQAAA